MGTRRLKNGPKEVEAAIKAEIIEVADWLSIAGALGANGVNSSYASAEDIETLLQVVKESDDLKLGIVIGPFEDLPMSWEPRKIVSEIVQAANPDAAMMDYYIRPINRQYNTRNSID